MKLQAIAHITNNLSHQVLDFPIKSVAKWRKAKRHDQMTPNDSNGNGHEQPVGTVSLPITYIEPDKYESQAGQSSFCTNMASSGVYFNNGKVACLTSSLHRGQLPCKGRDSTNLPIGRPLVAPSLALFKVPKACPEKKLVALAKVSQKRECPSPTSLSDAHLIPNELPSRKKAKSGNAVTLLFSKYRLSDEERMFIDAASELASSAPSRPAARTAA